ncbi:MAG: right-handed parallel beta-helix repeat-containing protein [Acidobacteriota bacterium]|nr:right-handed parallel beta-helix repeat-containing protein [Acidobacteriota bacterium]
MNRRTSPFGCSTEPRRQHHLVSGCADLLVRCRRRRPEDRAGQRPATTFLILALALATITTAATATTGPQTTPINLDAYTQILHVSTTTGNDATATGTTSAPYATLTAALAAANANANTKTAILIAAGTYPTHNLTLPPNTDLYGGFDPTSTDDWTPNRDIQTHPTILDAQGEDRVLTIAATPASAADTPANATNRLDGLHIQSGLASGPGGGILIDGASPVLTNNVFTGNATRRPADWAPKYLHETAHDGGAIYCRNGGAPVIRNNLIAENATETGRGAGIAFDHNCDGLIADNAIVGNVAGGSDAYRSSDGGGISIFNWSSPEISGNVVLGNYALNNNDGGGIFVAYWSSARVRDNIIVGNEGGDDGGGLFVGGQEHRYDRPFDPMPSAEDFFVEVTGNRFFGNTNPSRNSGALRITMESRGLVTRNVAALNSGFYLQRSELEVTDNTILEDTILIETKEGLEPTRFSNNIVTGSFESDGTATGTGSLARDGFRDEGNEAGLPEFLEDAAELQVVAASYSPSRMQTHVTVAAPLPADDLTGRVVVSHDDWGVVHSASGRHLTIWGSLRFATELRMLPTYRQIADSPGFGKGFDAARAVSDYEPRRVNKSIELLERGQPIYYDASTGGYEEGLQMAGTWGDYIIYNVEHVALDFAALREFMRGLVDAGPTPSGHRTPTVIVSLPLLGLDEPTVTAGGWMVQQALAQGVHGVHLARARDPEGVKRFVQAARYPIHKQAVDIVGEGLRGWGSHTFAAWVWGLSVPEYLQKADVWPLNPEGEIMLGVKLEDQQALDRAAETLSVPGLAFAEHGPRDLGLSYGYLEGRADPPLPPEVVAAGDMVLELTKERGMFFLDNVLPGNVAAQIDRGVMIGAGRREDSAEVGRGYSRRRMPW